MIIINPLSYATVLLSYKGRPLLIKTSNDTIRRTDKVASNLTAVRAKDTVLFIESNHEIVVLEKINSADGHEPKANFHQEKNLIKLALGKLNIVLDENDGISIKQEQSVVFTLTKKGELSCSPSSSYLQSKEYALQCKSPTIAINPGENNGMSS